MTQIKENDTTSAVPSEAVQAKRVPSVSEINRLAAELIGWSEWGTGVWAKSPQGQPEVKPDFCSPDCPASLTAQMWSVLKSYRSGFGMENYIKELCAGTPPKSYAALAEILQLPPRRHAVAFLLAMDAWPEDWSVPTE